jgi:hypothetical protein
MILRRKRRIFYHCYDSNQPTGGQKSTYQHVDVLTRYGFEAYVVHSSPGFRLRWFDNNTPTTCWDKVWQTFDPDADILVLPEDLSRAIHQYRGKKVIFNKNLFYGFCALGVPSTFPDPYTLPDVIGAMVVSEHNRQSLEYAYPRLFVRRVWEHIDSNIFAFRSLATKARQITYIPKALWMISAIYHTLMARSASGFNTCQSLKWVALEGQTETEVARILGDSLIFLFASVTEGLGRAPLEAALSGCVVLACNAGPIPEYLPAPFRMGCADPVDFVRAIEKAVNAQQDAPDVIERHINTSRLAALQFSADAQERSVCSAWDDFLRRA